MNNLGLVDQYLHWAMIALAKEQHPEAEVVIIEIDTRRMQCTTRTVDKREEYTRTENALDVVFTCLTGPKFNKAKLIEYVRKVSPKFSGKHALPT